MITVIEQKEILDKIYKMTFDSEEEKKKVIDSILGCRSYKIEKPIQ